MKEAVDVLVKDFEAGRISRRSLVGKLCAISALAAAGGNAAAQPAAQPAASTFEAVGLNHIALNVPDVQGARDFYLKHLGMTVSRESDSNCFMTCGNNFVALFRNSNAGLNHYCYSVKNFDVAEAERTLDEAGLEPRREGGRIYFQDNQGLTVQLSTADHTA